MGCIAFRARATPSARRASVPTRSSCARTTCTRWTIADSVKAIGRAGAGTNNIPVAAMSERGVPVFNAPGANANAVNELVLAALLMAARNVGPALVVRRGPRRVRAPTSRRRVEDGKKQFAGVELPHRTLGVVGLGAIGGLVADTAIKLGMKVVGFDPEITVDAAWRLHSGVRRAHGIEELLKQADFVTLHVPLLPVTRNLIDAKRLAVDEARRGAAQLRARRHRRRRRGRGGPRGAEAQERTSPTSRARGSSASPAWSRCRISARRPPRPRRTARSWSSTRCASTWSTARYANAVNFPSVEMMRESPFRVAIANANVPNMLGQISTTMAHAGLNIHNMVNKSRGEMAYTLVDVDSPVDETARRRAGGDPRGAVGARDTRRSGVILRKWRSDTDGAHAPRGVACGHGQGRPHRRFRMDGGRRAECVSRRDLQVRRDRRHVVPVGTVHAWAGAVATGGREPSAATSLRSARLPSRRHRPASETSSPPQARRNGPWRHGGAHARHGRRRGAQHAGNGAGRGASHAHGCRAGGSRCGLTAMRRPASGSSTSPMRA